MDDLTIFQDIERKKFYSKYTTGYYEVLKPKTPNSSEGKRLLKEAETLMKEYINTMLKNNNRLLTDKDTPLEVINHENCQIEKKLKAEAINKMIVILLELNDIEVEVAQSYLTAVESNHPFIGNKLSMAFHKAYHK
jgi:hypothetical protein